MACTATRKDIPTLCQNEKKRMPLTHKNLATRVLMTLFEEKLRLTDGTKGLEIFRYCDPEHRQAAGEGFSERASRPRRTHYKLRQMLVLYTTLMYVYPASLAKRPSRNVPVAFMITVAKTSKGLICTYSTATSQPLSFDAAEPNARNTPRLRLSRTQGSLISMG